MNQTGFLDMRTTGTHTQQVSASLAGMGEIKDLMTATSEALSSANSLNPKLDTLRATLTSSSTLLERVLDPTDAVSARSMASLSGFYSTVESLLNSSDIVMSNGDSLAAFLKEQQALTKAQILQAGTLEATLQNLGNQVEGSFEDFAVRNATEISTQSIAGDVIRATATSLAGPLAPIVPMLDSLINIDKITDSLGGKLIDGVKSIGRGGKQIVGDIVKPEGGFIDRKLEAFKLKRDNKRRIKLERKAEKRERKADIRRSKELARRLSSMGVAFDSQDWLAKKEAARLEKYAQVADNRESEFRAVTETRVADLIAEANAYTVAQPQEQPQEQPQATQATQAQPQATLSPIESFISDTLSSDTSETPSSVPSVSVSAAPVSAAPVSAAPVGALSSNTEPVVEAIKGKDGVVDTLLDIQQGDYDFFSKQFDELKKETSSDSVGGMLGGAAAGLAGAALAGLKSLLGKVMPTRTTPTPTRTTPTTPVGTTPSRGSGMGKYVKGAGLLGLATGAYSIYQDATDDTKTTSEKEIAVSGDVGGMAGAGAGAWAGAGAGAAIGTLILPGVGTAVGGFLGGIFGGISGYTAGKTIAEGGARMVVGEDKSNTLEPQPPVIQTVVVPPPVVHVDTPKEKKDANNVNTTSIPMRHDELGAAMLNGGGL